MAAWRRAKPILRTLDPARDNGLADEAEDPEDSRCGCVAVPSAEEHLVRGGAARGADHAERRLGGAQRGLVVRLLLPEAAARRYFHVRGEPRRH